MDRMDERRQLETVETVAGSCGSWSTLLKQGVNETGNDF
jgi:hypothetical protein